MLQQNNNIASTSNTQPENEQGETILSCDTDINCPPGWQRVPMRSNKRKKLSQTPSPEPLETSNRYSELLVDPPKDCTEQIKEKRTSKPPPIILYGIEDVNKLTELLETVAEKDEFTYKIVNRNQLRISSIHIEAYKRLIAIVRENNLVGHTFNQKDQRCYRLIIKNLHHTTPHTAIQEEIEKTGNKVFGEIINAKYGQEKKPTSTFFVNLVPGPNNKLVKSIKYIYHQSVTLEDPKKSNTIPQCQRCQQYGHSKNYCMRPYRCVKCAESHKTSDCPKKDRTTPATCALCEGSHPANYKGCEVYREILARRKNKNRIPKHNFMPDRLHSDKEYETNFPNLPRVNDVNTANMKRTWNSQQIEDKEPTQRTEMGPTLGTSTLEQILMKQNETFGALLQQMSTLMSLITKILDRPTK